MFGHWRLQIFIFDCKINICIDGIEFYVKSAELYGGTSLWCGSVRSFPRVKPCWGRKILVITDTGWRTSECTGSSCQCLSGNVPDHSRRKGPKDIWGNLSSFVNFFFFYKGNMCHLNYWGKRLNRMEGRKEGRSWLKYTGVELMRGKDRRQPLKLTEQVEPERAVPC